MTFFLAQEPSSLNGYLDGFSHVQLIFGALYESLLSTNPVTVEDEPNLAARWSIAADKKTFTFWIDPRARWSDGQPITAHDVKATFDAILASPRTGPVRLFLSRFASPTVVAADQIRFTAEQVHWNNLSTLGGFAILPAHLLAETPLDDLNFEFPITSGPYRIAQRRPGQSVSLSRQPDWWQHDFQRNRHKFNFDTIRFRFFAQRPNALEAFKKARLMCTRCTPRASGLKKPGARDSTRTGSSNSALFNAAPVGFQGFALNLRRAPYDDLRVRRALGHLIDRKRMNELLMYNDYALHRSYYEDLYTRAAPTPNPLTEYSLETARACSTRRAGRSTRPPASARKTDARWASAF